MAKAWNEVCHRRIALEQCLSTVKISCHIAKVVGLTEITGHENTGHEIARHDKYRTKIDYITLGCAFSLNFNSFICKASVLTYKKTTAPAHHKYSSVL